MEEKKLEKRTKVIIISSPSSRPTFRICCRVWLKCEATVAASATTVPLANDEQNRSSLLFFESASLQIDVLECREIRPNQVCW
ncbi:hypothetical protein T06_16786 [Trichinella sp. T6]|nr:hypothetical protein T06_16786 [Trichinella sp. T6]